MSDRKLRLKLRIQTPIVGTLPWLVSQAFRVDLRAAQGAGETRIEADLLDCSQHVLARFVLEMRAGEGRRRWRCELAAQEGIVWTEAARTLLGRIARHAVAALNEPAWKADGFRVRLRRERGASEHRNGHSPTQDTRSSHAEVTLPDYAVEKGPTNTRARVPAGPEDIPF